jgi:hypothetical protein
MPDRSISTDIWVDMEDLDFSPVEKWVFIFLCTCPRSQVCGLFKFSSKEVANNIGASTADVINAISALEARGWLIADGNVVFLRKYGKRQKAEKLSYFVDHALKVAKDIMRPNNRASEAFYQVYREALGQALGEALPQALGEAIITITNGSINKNSNKGGAGVEKKPPDFLEAAPLTLTEVSGFAEAWAEWVGFRSSDLKKPISKLSAKKQFKFLAEQPNPVAVIDRSIENGWQGLFPIKEQGYLRANEIIANPKRTGGGNLGPDEFAAIARANNIGVPDKPT